LGTLRNVFSAIDSVLYKVVGVIAITFLMGTVVLITIEVFMRFFGAGLPWITEVAQLLLVSISFTAMAIGVREKLHISLSVVYDRMPELVKKIFDKIGILCCLVFGGVIGYVGYGWMSTLKSTLPSTQWPSSVRYVTCTVFGFVIAYQSIISLLTLDKHALEKEAALKNAQQKEPDEEPFQKETVEKHVPEDLSETVTEEGVSEDD